MCDNVSLKKICDICDKKICLHANIPGSKAALMRNYFSRHNNFHLNGSRLLSLSLARLFLTE